jgi:phage/plasmid-like protein (TIGR03299 family)
MVYMSYHDEHYLNSGQILVGCGKQSWWRNQKLEDPNNPTHFDGFIPLSLVQEKLFGWETLESLKLEATFQVVARDYNGQVLLIEEFGNEPFILIKKVNVKSYKALGREDWVLTGVPQGEQDGADAILSIQGETYGVHQLKKVFIQTTADIVGGSDQIGVMSAGLLKWGRRAWITVTIPEVLHSDKANFDYRPCLTVSTSFDGSLPTSWTRTYDFPVCDNTLDYQLMKAGESGKFVLKHTKNSVARIGDAKAALGLLEQQSDEMDKALAELVNVEVTEAHFQKWLNEMIPVADPKVTEKMVSVQGEMVAAQSVSTRGQTISLNKRDKVIEMWDNDPRVAPWKNTKFGILQLWNTFQTHEASVKGKTALGGNEIQARVEANMMRVIKPSDKNSFVSQDSRAMELLESILDQDFAMAGAALPEAPAPKTRSRKTATASTN